MSLSQGAAIILFLMSRESVWERKMLILLRCMDALMQDFRDVYGETEVVSESLVEAFKSSNRPKCVI